MRLFTRLFLSLLLALQPASALPQSNYDELPSLGDSSGQVISPQQDKALGAAFMRQVRQAGMVLEDTEATAYLAALGHKLAMYSENPGYGFTFFLVNDPGINAFAGPGGYIGVNYGLFLTSESESELAGVMAHEIAHVTQRHLARAFEAQDRMSVPTAAALLAAILIGATTDGSTGTAALVATSAASMQYQINFTRANEKEADSVGIQTLADAGLDPFGMPQFFERLQKNSKLYGTRPPEFLSTHPVTTNRIAEATSRAESFPRAASYNELDFQLIRAKLRIKSYKDPRQVLADHQRYRGESGGDSAADRYEYALLLAANERYGEARKIIQQLHDSDPDRITYRLALARILGAEKQFGKAQDIYRSTLDLYPGNLVVILPYASTMMTAGQADEAYQLLVDVSRKNLNSPQVFKMLAQAAGTSEHPLQTHAAMSQYYFLNGFTNQAIEQLKLAAKTPGVTDYQTARIQARIKALEELLETKDSE